MAKRISSKTELLLLDRWKSIEQEDDTDEPHRFHLLKEQWFSDAFNFLIHLPNHHHIWCGSWDLMGPLLETFYNYFKDDTPDSPLRRLWKRLSQEMRHCIQCISQHHQATHMYTLEYELTSIGPLLDVLRRLDEERVTHSLTDIINRISHNQYDAAHDHIQLVTVMYEVLMFPALLEDQSLFTEFGNFIEAVDNIHELALDGQQQFSEYKEWMCIPMLWIDVLVEVDPLVLPVSFSKAVFWARSRFSMVESETSAEGELPLRTWISSSSFEISGSLGWKVPTGSDDGRDRKESKNSVEVCTTFLPLIKTFSRLTTHFLVLLGQGELRKQWTWEPRMGETLVLSLFDSSDKARQFGKHVLEQISSTKGLSCGLEFLCSSEYSLSAIFLGLRHALRLGT